MFKNPYFYGERGCLWWAINAGLLVFAVLCLIAGENTRLAWSILLTDVLDVTIYVIDRLVGRKRYYREDSFWLKKDDQDETTAQDAEKE